MKKCIKERTAVTRNNNRSGDKLQFPPEVYLHYTRKQAKSQ